MFIGHEAGLSKDFFPQEVEHAPPADPLFSLTTTTRGDTGQLPTLRHRARRRRHIDVTPSDMSTDSP